MPKRPTSPKFEGVYYMLGTDPRHGEEVHCYSQGDMEEVFSERERLALDSGLSVRTANGMVWTNMLVQARAAPGRIAARTY